MAPVANRLTIDSTGSTSSIGTGVALVEPKLEQAAERAEPLVLVVDQPGVLLEDVVAARLGGVLEPEDGLGVEQVVLAVAAPLVLAPFEEPGRPHVAAGVGAVVVVERLRGDLRQADAADPRGGLVEVAAGRTPRSGRSPRRSALRDSSGWC